MEKNVAPRLEIPRMPAMPALETEALPRLSRVSLPDVASSDRPLRARGAIDRVGMEKIELPIRLRGELMTVPAEADVLVSLDREERLR